MTSRNWGLPGVGTFLFLAGMVGLPTSLHAQAGRSAVEEGNRLYEEGRFEEAHERYLEALRADPESPLIRFNAGNALYQSADFEKALEAYQQAIESGDPQLASAAWYNMGNALYRAQQLEPSLEAYKQALRMNPGDADAKHNLERVLEQLQQQDQQQEGEDQQQEGDEGEDSEDQEQQEQEQEQDEQEQEQGQDQQDEQEQEQEQPQDQPQDQQPEDGEGQPEPRPDQMTPEEAERLLDAIEEDPEDVNRKPRAALGRKPKKIW